MGKKTEDGEPLVKLDLVEAVEETAIVAKPAEEVKGELSHDERIARLRANMQAIRDQVDEEGMAIVQFPTDIDDILESAYEHDSYARSVDESFTPMLDNHSWVDLSVSGSTTPEAQQFRKEREKIRKLDQILR